VASDRDPYNRIGAASLYADPLGIEFDLIEGGGHITPAEGYGPWPGVAEWCRGTADRVDGNTARQGPGRREGGKSEAASDRDSR
jgi:hypothetical protein